MNRSLKSTYIRRYDVSVILSRIDNSFSIDIQRADGTVRNVDTVDFEGTDDMIAARWMALGTYHSAIKLVREGALEV